MFLNPFRCLRLACLAGLCAAAPAPRAAAATVTYDFANSLEGWETGWHKESPTGTPGAISWSGQRSSTGGGGGSLKFDMGDGLGDDGTLWIARRFAAPAKSAAPVTVSFDLFSPQESFVNNFQVKVAVREDKPDQQSDFVTIGETGQLAGWVPYSFTRTLTSQSGGVWVAVGIRVSWETHRDYWIDHVSVTGPAVPEPLGGVGLLAFAGVLVTRRSRRTKC